MNPIHFILYYERFSQKSNKSKKMDAPLFSIEIRSIHAYKVNPDHILSSVGCHFRPLLGLAVKHHTHDSHSKSCHAHHRNRVPEDQNRNNSRNSSLCIPKNLQCEGTGVLGHQEIGQIHQISHRSIAKQQEHNKWIPSSFLDSNGSYIPFNIKTKRKQNHSSHWSHVQQQIHRVQFLSLRGQQNPLNHRFQRSPSGRTNTNQKPKEMKQWLTITGQNNPKNHRQKRKINLSRLLLTSNQKSKNRSEKWRGSTDGLVKRNRKVTKRCIPTNNGETENGAKSKDFKKLFTRKNVLQRNNLKKINSNIAISRTSKHVKHREEDRVPVAIKT